MTSADRIETRLRLVEDHWALGEDEEALRCLGQAMEEAPNHPGIAEQLRLLRASAEADLRPLEVRQRLDGLADRVFGTDPEGEGDGGAGEEAPSEDLPSLASATLAELLADQGLHEKARKVANDVLERSPADERARTVLQRLSGSEGTVAPQIAALEGWLETIRQRRREEGTRA